MTLEEELAEWGYDDVVVFVSPRYETALIGITSDDRAVYDYGKMIDYLVHHDGFSYQEAVEWIEYNTIRALPYAGSKAPIIMYRLPE